MNQSLSSPSHSAAPEVRIALVSSSWHRDIVNQAVQAALAEVARSCSPTSRVDLFEVPGAFEIPLHAQKLAAKGRYDAIMACGLIVNGGIYRHEFVTTAVIDGLMRVQLDSGVPVFSAVLTPRDFHESDEHVEFFRAHFVKKGTELAQACIKTVVSLRELNAVAPRPVV